MRSYSLIPAKKETIADDHNQFAYTVNNIPVSWNADLGNGSPTGAIIIKVPDRFFPNKTYLLQGWDTINRITVNLSLSSPTINVGTYKTKGIDSVSAPVSSYITNTTHYAPVNMNDSVEVIITGISNGYASGTFKSTMHAFPGWTNRLEILNGSFSHVLISD